MPVQTRHFQNVPSPYSLSLLLVVSIAVFSLLFVVNSSGEKSVLFKDNGGTIYSDLHTCATRAWYPNQCTVQSCHGYQCELCTLPSKPVTEPVIRSWDALHESSNQLSELFSAEVRYTSAVHETNSSCTLQQDERRLCSFLHINIPRQVVQSDWSCTWLQSDPLSFVFCSPPPK